MQLLLEMANHLRLRALALSELRIAHKTLQVSNQLVIRVPRSHAHKNSHRTTKTNSVKDCIGDDHDDLRMGCMCSGKSNLPPTPILVKSIVTHLPFLSRYFCKSIPSSLQKVVGAPPICITIRLLFPSRCLCRSIRVRGRWNTRSVLKHQQVVLKIARTRIADQRRPSVAQEVRKQLRPSTLICARNKVTLCFMANLSSKSAGREGGLGHGAARLPT